MVAAGGLFAARVVTAALAAGATRNPTPDIELPDKLPNVRLL
jgi:hypothetical protein